MLEDLLLWLQQVHLKGSDYLERTARSRNYSKPPCETFSGFIWTEERALSFIPPPQRCSNG
jgi:hypothetical protein